MLLVDDNPADTWLLAHALKARVADGALETTIVADGTSAIEFLQEHNLPDNTPDLVVLDLNLPRRNGIEILKAIRKVTALRYLPVVLLSSLPIDFLRKTVENASTQANGYFTKPLDIDGYYALSESMIRLCGQPAGPFSSVELSSI